MRPTSRSPTPRAPARAGETAAAPFHRGHFVIPEGELVLVVGPTGSGKSTLLRCVNGLVPHFSGGTLQGTVTVGGRDTRQHRPRDLADLVGFVVQDPTASFVTDTVEEEIAYGMEAMGVDATAMRRRVEETLDLLGLADVRSRPLRDLSGGQQQRVAIGAVLAAGPRILVLDEPTSALDPVAAEDVLATLNRLVHDLGITVVVAEHRLERVIHHADHVVLIRDGVVSGLLEPEPRRWCPPRSTRPSSGWAGRWLVAAAAVDPRRAPPGREGARAPRRAVPSVTAAADPQPASPAVEVDGLSVRRGGVVALRGVSLEVRPGEVVAVMGRNGAGKSTLLASLVGQARRSAGSVRLGTLDPAGAAPAEVVRRAGMVPQDPALILYAESVADECAAADRDFALPAGHTAAVLDEIVPGLDGRPAPPGPLRGAAGLLALAVVLASEPGVVLLDEPTRGLDYAAKRRLVDLLRGLATRGHAVVLATHDVELAAEVATGSWSWPRARSSPTARPRAVLPASPAFAPQVSKILHPLHFLTVDQVAAALWLAVGCPASSDHCGCSCAAPAGHGLWRWPSASSAWSRSAGPSRRLARSSASSGTAATPRSLRRPHGPAGLVLLAEMTSGGVDAKGIAVLGALAAAGGALRVLSAGTAGLEPMFFLLVIAGRVLGASKGFLLGAIALLTSAFLTAGIGPWTPFQMIARGWVAMGGGLLPRVTSRAERWLLAAYGLVCGMVYGAVMNLWFWPFMGSTAPAGAGFVPDAGAGVNLGHYAVFYAHDLAGLGPASGAPDRRAHPGGQRAAAAGTAPERAPGPL